MSRTIRGSKGPGYDYWSRRYRNAGGTNCPSKGVKRRTNRAERRIARQNVEALA